MALFVVLVVGVVVAQTWMDWRDAKRNFAVPEWAKGVALAGIVGVALTTAMSFASVWLQDYSGQWVGAGSRLFWPELGLVLCAMGIIVAAVQKKRMRLMLLMMGLLVEAFWLGLTLSIVMARLRRFSIGIDDDAFLVVVLFPFCCSLLRCPTVTFPSSHQSPISLLSRHARNSYTHPGQHLLLAGEAMGLQIAIRHAGDVTILDLQGRATIGPTNDSLSANLRKLIDAGESKILLNLAGATQIDSSSISTIVRAFVSLRNRGASLKLLSAHGNVKLVLEMFRLLNVIPNFDDETEALISFESRKASSH